MLCNDHSVLLFNVFYTSSYEMSKKLFRIIFSSSRTSKLTKAIESQ